MRCRRSARCRSPGLEPSATLEVHRARYAPRRARKREESWHVFKDLRAVLRLGVANLYLEHTPTEGMTAPGRFTPGERTLTAEEIHQLWHVLPQALDQTVNARRIIQLCLVTGQRLGEVSGMRRSELDLKHRLWSLPGTRTKNGHPHTVPLSNLAVTLIEEALGRGRGRIS